MLPTFEQCLYNDFEEVLLCLEVTDGEKVRFFKALQNEMQSLLVILPMNLLDSLAQILPQHVIHNGRYTISTGMKEMLYLTTHSTHFILYLYGI